MKLLLSRNRFSGVVKRSVQALFCVLVIEIWALPVVNAQDYGKGRSAFDASNYELAIAQWRPLAERNNPEAQAALGYLYLKGMGLKQDYAQAAKWYQKAAEKHEVHGPYFLGTQYHCTCPIWGCSKTTGLPTSCVKSSPAFGLAQEKPAHMSEAK